MFINISVAKNIETTIGTFDDVISIYTYLRNTLEKIPGLGSLIEKLQDSISGG